MFGDLALQFLDKKEFTSVLDIGAGRGEAARHFMQRGKSVTSVDIANVGAPNLISGNYMELKLDKYDLIWASHVLEHQLNVNAFLKKCRSEQEVGGLICVTVPPLKHEIVGGHVTLWNAGLLMYNLILAGYNCSDCHVKQYDYNISVIAKADNFKLPALRYDYGDIEILSSYFPREYSFQGFNGDIREYNWKDII